MNKRKSLDKNRIIDLLVAGKTPRQIAKEMGATSEQVNFNIAWYSLDIRAFNKGMVGGSYTENGVTIQKIKSAYAEGAEPKSGMRY